MRVDNIMRTELISAMPHLPARHAYGLMRGQDLDCFPVVNERTELIGVVSERDIVQRAFYQPAPGAEALVHRDVQVRDIMTSALITVAPDTPAQEAVALMIEGRITCLPVVQGRRLVGIITRTDLLALLERALVIEAPTPRAGLR